MRNYNLLIEDYLSKFLAYANTWTKDIKVNIKIMSRILEPIVTKLNIGVRYLDNFLNFEKNIIIRTYDGYYFLIRGKLDDLRFALLTHEPYEYKKWFLKYVKGVVVDVGAYIGGYTVRASKLADFVVAIEPQPNIFKLLSFNVKINGYSEKVKLVNKAV